MSRKIRMTKAIREAAASQIQMNDEFDEREHEVFLALESARIIEEAFAVLEAERLAAEKAKADAKLCRCGCGGTPVGKTARFIPGHDGRLKGRLLTQARSDNPELAAEAAVQLAFFGWSHFLVETTKAKKKRQAAERRAAKAAEEAGEPAPEPTSTLTPEMRARIAAMRAQRNGGMRDLTSRRIQDAPVVA